MAAARRCPEDATGRRPRFPIGRRRRGKQAVGWRALGLPGYFDTLGVRLVRGRVFTDRDRPASRRSSWSTKPRRAAFWPNEDPIGKRIGLGQGGFQDGAEVVGIVADVRYGASEAAVGPDAYLPLLQSPRALGFIFVRSRVRRNRSVPGSR